MTAPYPRDMVGYGRTPPFADWPGGARLALNVVFNVEEGSEYSIPDGDGFSEAVLTELASPMAPQGQRCLGSESMFEYGSRVGFWRLHRLMRERGMKPTIFGCAVALERNPEIAAAIVEAGYDVVSHGWRWIHHYELDLATEREHIRKAVASFQRTLGFRPLGWYCRGAPSVNTRRLVVEEGGFLFDSDSYADELPYWVVQDGKPHLVVPYSLTNNDGLFQDGRVGNGEQFFVFLRDAFDMLYAEGKTMPKMMSVGLHMRLAGHPGRAAGLARFLDHVARHKDVWIAGRTDIARHWMARHPYRAP
jgi:allantoinase